MSIREELLALQRDGLLLADRVVKWAEKHPDSALHKSLEWRDDVAAQEYRVWQVRRLIAVHVVTPEGRRQMLSLSIDRDKGGGYRSVEVVMKRRSLREAALADALAELERVRSKYDWLQELASVFAEVKKVKAG